MKVLQKLTQRNEQLSPHAAPRPMNRHKMIFLSIHLYTIFNLNAHSGFHKSLFYVIIKFGVPSINIRHPGPFPFPCLSSSKNLRIKEVVLLFRILNPANCNKPRFNLAFIIYLKAYQLPGWHYGYLLFSLLNSGFLGCHSSSSSHNHSAAPEASSYLEHIFAIFRSRISFNPSNHNFAAIKVGPPQPKFLSIFISQHASAT